MRKTIDTINSIFGEENFITMFCKKTVGGKQDSEHFAKIHEYILCYSNNQYIAGKDEKAPDSYPYFDEKTKKYYKTQLLRKWGDAARRVDREDMFYPIFWNGKKFSLEKNEFEHPKIILPMIDSNTEGRWRWGFNTMQDGINNNLITVKEENGELIAYEKIYEPDTKEETGTKLYRTWIDNIKNTTGTTLLKELFDGNSPFDYPKPVDLIKLILKMGNISNNYVLDFFSGSATTAQAVMELNLKDGGQRRFILCTNNENGICKDVTYQRLKTVITGKRQDGSEYSNGIPANLMYFRTDFVDKESEELSEELLAHIREMIQLEHGIKIDDQKYVIIMDDEAMDAFEQNFSSYTQLKAVFINQDVFLSSSQEEMLENVASYIIPDYYFDFELREAGEIW